MKNFIPNNMSIESFMLTAGVIFIIGLVIIIFILPSEKKKKKKRDSKLQSEEDSLKRDWKMTAQRLEQLVKSLNHKIAELQKINQDKDKQLAVEAAKIKKLKEKMDQDRFWHEKERKDIKQSSDEIYHLKKEIVKHQENFAREHSLTLQLRSKYDELKTERDKINEQRRVLEVENIAIKEKNDHYRCELAKLKSDNIELTKKNEGVNWVAKEDYIKLDKRLKEVQTELNRVRRQ